MGMAASLASALGGRRLSLARAWAKSAKAEGSGDQFALVEVAGVEFAGGLQGGPVHDHQLAAMEGQQALAAQRLEGAVGVDGGETERIAEVLLGDRKRASALAHEPGSLHPHDHLAEEMGDA